MNDEDQPQESSARRRALARLPTGARLVLILSAALLPLALLAMAAAFQTTRTADQENKARLRVAAMESARALSIELVGDMNALRSVLSAIESDASDAPSCARARGVFAQAAASGVRFEIVNREGQRLCGEELPVKAPDPVNEIASAVIPGRGLALSLGGRDGLARAAAFFPSGYLEDVSRPSGFQPNYDVLLIAHGQELELREMDEDSPLARMDRIVIPVGVESLNLAMRTPAAPITSALLLAMLTPLLMWIAAVGIAWFVVDRLLIRPLRRLRHSVGEYTPGTPFEPALTKSASSHEIRQLGATFGDLGRALQTHEEELAAGLVRQTKLTREVHHRVKNNLQVIASLINFHARGAITPEAAAAYASIQRRVDALAVVHRNHFAEIEVNRGLSLRAVLSELSANIRATAPDRSSQLSIALEVPPFLVTQDTAVAVAFLMTELIELAIGENPEAQLRISARAADEEGRATLRLSSSALIETEQLKSAIATRYGRVMEGLSRQLRAKLHYEPLIGAYEIGIAVTGCD